MNPLPNPQSRT